VTVLPRFHTSPFLLVLCAGVLAACGGAAAAPDRTGHVTAGVTAREHGAGRSADTASAPLTWSADSDRANGPAATLGNCPVFPASNVWNTDISRLPVDKHSAA